jgi:hypothetical protein
MAYNAAAREVRLQAEARVVRARLWRHELHRRHHAEACARMAAAARLHPSASTPQEGPDSNEAAAGGTATASTTTTRYGGLSGCNTQSA